MKCWKLTRPVKCECVGYDLSINLCMWNEYSQRGWKGTSYWILIISKCGICPIQEQLRMIYVSLARGCEKDLIPTFETERTRYLVTLTKIGRCQECRYSRPWYLRAPLASETDRMLDCQRGAWCLYKDMLVSWCNYILRCTAVARCMSVVGCVACRRCGRIVMWLM